MEDFHKEVLSAVSLLLDHGGFPLTNRDLQLFEKNPDDVKQYAERLSAIYDAIVLGFFSCAAQGITLYPERKVIERFGSSFSDNYPEASDAFLRFAKTYWTLRVLVYDLMDEDYDWVGAHLLWKLEQDIGPIFFPFPGPLKIDPSKREKDQRALLEEFGKDIDVEEFMRGNPILIRDRQSSIWEKFKRFVSGT